ncbi:MAG: hypothetical protein DHS20C18_40970 [Saprospiraceae bacterium]|nr:MAG: hypothetical protein DHS20C18_40970 [Saprospiraceae bacterium]
MRLSLSILFFVALLVSCQDTNKRSYSASAPFLENPFSEVDSLLDHLSQAEKIGQLIIYRNDNQAGFLAQNIAAMAHAGRIGGFWLKDLVLSDYLAMIETETEIPLINISGETGLLNNLFTDIPGVPGTSALLSYPPDTLKDKLITLRRQQAYALGINAQVVPDNNSMWFTNSDIEEYLSLFNQRVLGLEMAFGPRFFERARDTLVRKAMLSNLLPKVDRGLCGFYLPKDSISELAVTGEKISDIFQSALNFDGLLVADASDSTRWNTLLVQGVDLFVINQNPESLIRFLLTRLRSGQWKEFELDQKLRKVLQAKYWARSGRMKEPKPLPVSSLKATVIPVIDRQPTISRKVPEVESHLRADNWEMISRQIYEKSIVVIPDTNFQIPIPEIGGHKYYVYHYADEPMREFNRTFARYASLISNHESHQEGGALRIPEPPDEPGAIVLILLDQQTLQLPRDTSFIAAIKDLVQTYPVVVYNFGNPDQLAPFNASFTVIQLPERNEITENMAAQLIFGGLETSGKLAYDINHFFLQGMGMAINPLRLGYSPSQMVGIAPEKLVGIDAIVGNAINEEVFPGCEILVAKKGKVIYSKTFGFQTYDEKRSVRENHLYDVASITKVAATTLGVMQLYDQGKIKLDDKLKSHLTLEPKATISDITLRKLLSHQSGLPPYLPVGRYLTYRDQPNAGCDSFFCEKPSDVYNIQVADKFYFKGSYIPEIWQDIQQIKVNKKKQYTYSDANFVLLQKVLEKEVGEPMNIWLDSNIYQPLGLRYTCFLPLTKFGDAVIAPTQKDDRWRHQLVRGNVHDETSALLGGVAGHAGLFSTAGDLAVIGQLLLNKGTYGGHRYFKESTVRTFTSAKHGNHRGLGFDKPAKKYNSAHAPSASEHSFGHTGFTGTCFWVDPDEELVFVFLSNRIYPDINNKKLFQKKIREWIHEVVYKALDSYHFELPQLNIEVPGVS